MKKFIFIGIILGFFALTGCSNSTPNCSDKDTTDLVIEIAKDELKREGLGKIIPKLDFRVDGISTIERDKELDTYKCKADFKMINKTNGVVKTLPITYRVYSTDKGDEFYVEVIDGF